MDMNPRLYERISSTCDMVDGNTRDQRWAKVEAVAVRNSSRKQERRSLEPVSTAGTLDVQQSVERTSTF
ncbi:hypothetical protein PSACC_03735 [Paramicrosporidium saccamoebae]|uniref:Uncharacterized protein n=1 Tax=Paramicrosporidium saccamoebae TaxID=1246581 RepID=A0A2H9TFD9_9FUNG|nr:hypothetical protein PSACC_03735 [Paramicrosporidium saccamoebae]